MACIWHFILMSCPKPPMGISSVGSFPVQSGSSLIIFKLFRCRNLALNRMFPTLQVGMGVVGLGGIYMPPCLYVLCIFVHPIHPNSPIPPVLLYVLCSPDVMGTWGRHQYISCLELFWGASVHLSGILVSVSTSICLSVHNSHASCCPSFWVASLLDWILMDVCYTSCCCFFLCSFHYASSLYYHGYVYYSSGDCCDFWYVISSLNGYHGPLLDGAFSNIRLAWCGSATTADTKALWKCCWPCHCATAATSISDAS